MLVRRKNPKTGTMQWALVADSKPSKVLKWFGSKKPSHERVLSAERRVQFFENLAKSTGSLRRKVRKKSLLPPKRK